MSNSLFKTPFQLVAVVHFLFISNAMLGNWGHGAYEFYNFFFIIAMIMAIHYKDSVDPIQIVSIPSLSIFDWLNVVAKCVLPLTK